MGGCVSVKLFVSYAKSVDAQFRLGLITADYDDNKFVDCAIVSGAQFIVTNDSHFDALADIPFPKVVVRTIDEFLSDFT